MATIWPPDPDRSWKSACLPDHVARSLIPDHCILLVYPVILPETKKSLTTPETLTLEKDKSDLLNELNQSKWLENTIASNTKKLYEDKNTTIFYKNFISKQGYI